MTSMDTAALATSAGRRPGTWHVNRRRGALGGFLLSLLGLWGALIPFVGPYFNFAYTPDASWSWTWGRLWLEILPGAAAIAGGLMIALTGNRAVGVFGSWLGCVAGAWYVVGPIVSLLWAGSTVATGTPLGGAQSRVVEQIAMFAGLGVVILFLAAVALGRFSVVGVRDVGASSRAGSSRRDGASVRNNSVVESAASERATDSPASGLHVRPGAD